MSICVCCRPMIRIEPMKRRSFNVTFSGRNHQNGVVLQLMRLRLSFRGVKVRASMLQDSSSPDDSPFAKRIEQAWLISQQPTPISCSSCNSRGHVECKWCAGTGFFIIGDNMLCEVPSRNTSCVICTGEGSTRCSDCQGTGFRAKWLGRPPIYSE
ncbi:uncharacterized protein LOC141642417 [Silene latifolia]|uniref:uncharacterized protein LOC141642417 n=1 Tax=Silene latifolia TaxID=37657 RepID=UPI003D78A59C